MDGTCFVFIFCITLGLALAKAEPPRCDRGQWKQLSSLWQLPAGPHSAARSLFDPNQPKTSINTWLDQACPSQSWIYSCYFHSGDLNYSLPANRPFQIEARRFVPDDKRCLDFHPFDFLDLLRNRRVAFIGDSIMNQLWQSIACALYTVTPAHVRVSWEEKPESCPMSLVTHCHSTRTATVHFPSVNTTLTVNVLSYASPDLLRQLLSQRHATSSDDILILNIGLRIRDVSQYKGHLYPIFTEWAKSQENGHVLPHFLFLQTTPQHFNTIGGEFTGFKSSQLDSRSHCEIEHQQPNWTTNDWVEHMAARDWRNKIVDQLMEKYNNGTFFSSPSSVGKYKIGYMRSAEALYSQYDAHVDNIDHGTHFDCSHWCYPSGVFYYLQSVLYNSLVDLLGRRKELE